MNVEIGDFVIVKINFAYGKFTMKVIGIDKKSGLILHHAGLGLSTTRHPRDIIKVVKK